MIDQLHALPCESISATHIRSLHNRTIEIKEKAWETTVEVAEL